MPVCCGCIAVFICQQFNCNRILISLQKCVTQHIIRKYVSTNRKSGLVLISWLVIAPLVQMFWERFCDITWKHSTHISCEHCEQNVTTMFLQITFARKHLQIIRRKSKSEKPTNDVSQMFGKCFVLAGISTLCWNFFHISIPIFLGMFMVVNADWYTLADCALKVRLKLKQNKLLGWDSILASFHRMTEQASKQLYSPK